MSHGPLPTDLRIQVPRRSLASWYRIAAHFEPLLKTVGVEPNPSNLLAAMLEGLDGLTNPDRHMPSSNPDSPIEEWPDGSGMTIASGRIVRRLEPGIIAEAELEATPETPDDKLNPSKDETAEQPS